MQTNPFRHRDEGLQRVSAITRWVAGASAAAAAFFSIAAAHPKISVPKLGGSSPSASGTDDSTGDNATVNNGGSVDNGYADPNAAHGGADLTAPPAPPTRSSSRPLAASGSS